MQPNEPSNLSAGPTAAPLGTGPSAAPVGVPAAGSGGQVNEGKVSFGDDFRRFFLRGLATLMPTLITLSLLLWLWNFLWTSIGQNVIFGIRWVWLRLGDAGLVDREPAGHIRHVLNEDDFGVRVLGVGLSILLVYVVGVLVGNLIGRTFYRLGERAVMKVPLIRAIYPAVKQVTDFVLAEKSKTHFAASRVVAVQARSQGIWSVGFVTNAGYGPLNRATGGDMLTVFIPSTPTSFSGYVVVAHREAVVELPLSVEEAMRLLLSGGVIVPPDAGRLVDGPAGLVGQVEASADAAMGLPVGGSGPPVAGPVGGVVPITLPADSGINPGRQVVGSPAGGR
ncbi:MAG: hypothetical protein JWO31_2293 [Phycisphaerales bacterium]|nr:hypothetical protein [Phycisphaerales bacterium]